jgi:hypothetical protein
VHHHHTTDTGDIPLTPYTDYHITDWPHQSGAPERSQPRLNGQQEETHCRRHRLQTTINRPIHSPPLTPPAAAAPSDAPDTKDPQLTPVCHTYRASYNFEQVKVTPSKFMPLLLPDPAIVSLFVSHRWLLLFQLAAQRDLLPTGQTVKRSALSLQVLYLNRHSGVNVGILA